VRAVLAFLLLALPAFAQEPKDDEVPDEHKLTVRGCSQMGGWCAADVDVLTEYIRERVRLAKELQKLREIKGCAKVEVTEPPKKLPPLKKDRDS
jgi:hypothetical protein